MNSELLLELANLNLSAEQLAGVLRIIAAAEQTAENLRSEVERYRGVSKTRQLRYRQRHSNVTNGVTVTQPLARGTENITTSPSKKENKPPTLSLPPSEPAGFETLWSAYPKRDGHRDRKAAVKAFRAALRRAPFETILAGAHAYAADLKARGKENTEFVKQARTWLNADGWTEYDRQHNRISEEERAELERILDA